MRSKLTYNQREADEIIELIRLKLESDNVHQKTIRAKIRKLGFFASDFSFKKAYDVDDFLSVIKIADSPIKKATTHYSITTSNKLRKSSKVNDENYVIDLCDKILGINAIRQHRFDFLRGDSGVPLPVDAFYPTLNLVIEYQEKQHTEKVSFFDKRQTVSGVSRGEQRRLYDERRRIVLPEHGIKLMIISYSDFDYNSSKRIVRNIKKDFNTLKKKLLKYHCKLS